ncbi:MAG: hypothetical protein R3C10_22430 [Pirellulales bacterium]
MGNDVLAVAVHPLKKGKSEKQLRDSVPVSQIACRQRLGGALKHYYGEAA